jgi:hypothetical protein
VESVLGKNPFGFELVFGGNPEITDQAGRDLVLLKTKYPNVADWPVEKNVPDGARWRLDP